MQVGMIKLGANICNSDCVFYIPWCLIALREICNSKVICCFGRGILQVILLQLQLVIWTAPEHLESQENCSFPPIFSFVALCIHKEIKLDRRDTTAYKTRNQNDKCSRQVLSCQPTLWTKFLQFGVSKNANLGQLNSLGPPQFHFLLESCTEKIQFCFQQTEEKYKRNVSFQLGPFFNS